MWAKEEHLNTALAKYSADVYLFIDSDLMGTASEAEKLLYPVVNGECDMAIASFPPAKKKVDLESSRNSQSGL